MLDKILESSLNVPKIGLRAGRGEFPNCSQLNTNQYQEYGLQENKIFQILSIFLYILAQK